jgi:hypothetical protein
MTTFARRRADGRSNVEVLIDVISRDPEPGVIHSYDELGHALEEGADRAYPKLTVQRIVAGSLRQVGLRTKRALECVPGVGYRVVFAKEHMGLALKRKGRADIQLKKAFGILKNVRLDELDPANRAAHEAQFVMMSALLQNQVALDRRLQKTEQVIADMLKKKE